MSQDRPSAAQLLLAVRDFIEQELLPEAQGGRAFKLRVASNVLAIVERELTFAPASDTQEHVLLVALLGHDGYVHTLTNHKLQIANPSYR